MALQIAFAVKKIDLFAGSSVSYEGLLGMISLLPSIYQLAPKSGWEHFKNSAWAGKVEDRILSDSLKIGSSRPDPTRPNPIDIFPPFDEICGKGFSGRETQKCDLGIREFE